MVLRIVSRWLFFTHSLQMRITFCDVSLMPISAASEIPVHCLVRCMMSPHETQLKTLSFFEIVCKQDLHVFSGALEESVRRLRCSSSREGAMTTTNLALQGIKPQKKPDLGWCHGGRQIPRAVRTQKLALQGIKPQKKPTLGTSRYKTSEETKTRCFKVWNLKRNQVQSSTLKSYLLYFVFRREFRSFLVGATRVIDRC